MKLLKAELSPVVESTRLRILELKAEQAQGRLMIAQVASKMRKNQAELLTLQNKDTQNVKKPD